MVKGLTEQKLEDQKRRRKKLRGKDNASTNTRHASRNGR